VKPSKCAFGVQGVEYLGHIVSHEGVKVDHNKIKSMREWPIPKTLKKIRGLLGLVGYYRKFVKNYGQIETPLTKLLKKESFSWTQEETKAFEKIKEALYTTRFLATPNFTKTFIMECDASSHVIGVVLMQEGRPLTFESIQLKRQKLTQTYLRKRNVGHTTCI
jgi:hypothetical protein